MTDIVFLDTETTGVHPEREIWEIAMVKRYSDGSEREIVIQVSPVDLSKADPFGLKIGKFYDRYHVFNRDGMYPNTEIIHPYEAAIIVEKWTRGCHIVGAVPNFDTESLDKLLRTNEMLPAWHYHLIDVESLAIGYLMGKDHYDENPLHDSDPPKFSFSLPWKSDELSKAIGVEPPTDEERHTAMGDVHWVMRTYDKVMGVN